MKFLYIYYLENKRYLDTEKTFTLPFNLNISDLFELKDLKENLIAQIMNSKTRYYLITGENGTGKTTLIKSIIKDLKENKNMEIIFIEVESSNKFGEIFADSINFNFNKKQTIRDIISDLSIFSKFLIYF